MRRLPLPTSLAVALLIGSTPAVSAEYQMIGAGLLSCSSWTVYRRDDSTRVVWLFELEWVEGFLSGVSYAGNANPLEGRGSRGVAVWLDSYCHTHPLKPLAEAATAFVVEHPR